MVESSLSTSPSGTAGLASGSLSRTPRQHPEDGSGTSFSKQSPSEHAFARHKSKNSGQTPTVNSASRSRVPRRKKNKSIGELPLQSPTALPHPTSSSMTRQSRPEPDSGRYLGSNGHAVEHKQKDRLKEAHTSSSNPKYRSEPSARRARADSSSGADRQRRSVDSRLHGRVRAIKAPSVLSLLSGITSATGSSSGSNSTVTQRSYEKYRSSGHRRSPRKRRVRSEQEWSERSIWPASNESNEHIDVFNYMETGSTVQDDGWLSDSSSSCSSSSSSSSESEFRSRTNVTPAGFPGCGLPVSIPNAQDMAAWTNQDQLHYDSGISVCASSPESARRIKPVHKQPRAENLVEEANEDAAERQSTLLPNGEHPVTNLAAPRRSLIPVRCLDAHCAPMSLPPHHMSPSVPYPHPHLKEDHYSKQHRLPSSTQKRPLGGYDLLASKLSAHPHGSDERDGTLTPFYRKFETLNHRILLHLQDEIAELEEQLKNLDDGIGRECQDLDGKVRPASRRSDVRQGGELHFRRTETLGHIFVKTGQYNQALASYNALVSASKPAQMADLDRYRAWVKQQAPITDEEADFLNHHVDLVCFSDPHLASSTTNFTQYAAFGPAAAALLLVAVLMLPQPFGQLLVLVILGAGGSVPLLFCAPNLTMSQRASCVIMYVGFLAVAGVVGLVS